MIDAFESEFARRLAVKVAESRNTHATMLLNGKAETFEDYKAKSAYLQALRDVEGWMVEVRDDLTRPETEAPQPRRPLRQTASYSGA